jgi:hypothetical protein
VRPNKLKLELPPGVSWRVSREAIINHGWTGMHTDRKADYWIGGLMGFRKGKTRYCIILFGVPHSRGFGTAWSKTTKTTATKMHGAAKPQPAK